jgi:enoyl-CoA hydratase/carnithine racemase
MTYETILAEAEDGVGLITLNRPDKLNAMNRLLNRELLAAVKAFEADDGVGCIVLTGAGRAFSAGGDIHEQREDDRRYNDDELSKLRGGRTSLDIGICSKPTIGMMNGLAFWRRCGAGLLA